MNNPHLKARVLLKLPTTPFLANFRFVVYYRPIFLISFLQELFLRSAILF